MQAPQIKTALPGPKAKAIVERDHRYTAPAYGRVYPLVVERAQGMVVEDVDGNLFLDFMAGIAVASTGHSHPRVVQAIEEQARTAMAITKLDGTAKGGVVIGISDQFNIPVKYIGLGEKLDDLQVFNPLEFVDSLFSGEK